MLINIELAPSIQEKLNNKANQLGKALEEIIVEMIEEKVQEETEVKTKEDLLQKVNLGMSTDKWERYHELIPIRDAEKLTKEEHQELMAISDEIEERNAERMPYVFQLAALEGIRPELIIQQLGIQ